MSYTNPNNIYMNSNTGTFSRNIPSIPIMQTPILNETQLGNEQAYKDLKYKQPIDKSFSHIINEPTNIDNAYADTNKNCRQINIIENNYYVTPDKIPIPSNTPSQNRPFISGVPTPSYLPQNNNLPGVPTPSYLPQNNNLSGVPTPSYLPQNNNLPGVVTPSYLPQNNNLPGVPTPSYLPQNIPKPVQQNISGVPTPTHATGYIPKPVQQNISGVPTPTHATGYIPKPVQQNISGVPTPTHATGYIPKPVQQNISGVPTHATGYIPKPVQQNISGVPTPTHATGYIPKPVQQNISGVPTPSYLPQNIPKPVQQNISGVPTPTHATVSRNYRYTRTDNNVIPNPLDKDLNLFQCKDAKNRDITGEYKDYCSFSSYTDAQAQCNKESNCNGYLYISKNKSNNKDSFILSKNGAKKNDTKETLYQNMYFKKSPY
jgi:hypothetical protein